MTIKAPDTVRQWQRNPAINSAVNDYTNKNGVRISLPCYVDLSTQQRKELLNGVREAIQNSLTISEPASLTGIRVETVNGTQSDVESYLGVSVEVLRSLLFQRGGIEVSLVLRLQEVTGITFITDKDFAAAFKSRQDLIKGYLTEYPLVPNS